jgi:hypothetical protein
MGAAGTASAEHFLTRLFRMYATGSVLEPLSVHEIFSVTNDRKHPFGGIFPDGTHHNNEACISLKAWLNLWRYASRELEK